MTKLQITIKDYVHCIIKGLDSEDTKRMYDEYSVFVPSARFSPKYKIGYWDGKIHFFQLSGATYTTLLSDILSKLDMSKYELEYVSLSSLVPDPDLGEDIDENYLSYMNWYEGHRLAGKPIKLEEHQVRCVNTMIHNHRGLLSSATGSGKCVSYENPINIAIGNSDFMKFINGKESKK